MRFTHSAPPVRHRLSSVSPAHLRWIRLLLPAIILATLPLSSFAQEPEYMSPAMAKYYEGYYLQHEQQKFTEALEAYQLAKSLAKNNQTAKKVNDALSDLREDLASSNFAKLMPEDAFAYVEISRPADHVEQLARLMGLTEKTFSDRDQPAVLRVDGVAISSDFQISPALLREMKKFRGAAAAVTEITDSGEPRGVAVIHPGDSDLLTGLLETGIQLVPGEKKIEGLPTFQIENRVWLVKTSRMIVVSTDEEQIVACVNRLKNASAKSLADNPKFSIARKQNEGVAVFAFADPAKVIDQLGRQARQEIAIAKMMLDINHMNFVSVAMGSTETGAQFRVDVDFQEGHQSLAYGLIRTAPLSGKALNGLPAEAVGVVGIGINPKVAFAAQAAGGRYLSALDIGREFFANMEEAGLFLLPTRSRNSPVPDVGLVIASSDIEKSEQLWSTLLQLPARMNVDQASVETQNIQGVKAHVYKMPSEMNMPPIVVARLNQQALIAGTRNAVEVAIAASKSGKTLANDPQAKTLWDATTEHTAKAAFIRVGRAMQMAGTMEGGREGQMLNAFGKVAEAMNVTLVVNEAPTHFSTVLNANQFPSFESIIKTMSKMDRSVASARSATANWAGREVRAADGPRAQNRARAKRGISISLPSASDVQATAKPDVPRVPAVPRATGQPRAADTPNR